MNHQKTLKISLAIGWLVTALVIIFVAPLLVPEESRNSYFWYRVLWTEVLCFLVWSGSSFFFFVSNDTKDSTSRLGGIAPTISGAIVLYSLISFFLMILASSRSENDFISRMHLILQIVLFALCVLIGVFLSISRVGAIAGHRFENSELLTPSKIHNLLGVYEDGLKIDGRDSQGQKLKDSIKRLRETVNYSLNESSRLSELIEYQSFSQNIKEFCGLIEKHNSSNGVGGLELLAEKAVVLNSKAKLISTMQVRR